MSACWMKVKFSYILEIGFKCYIKLLFNYPVVVFLSFFALTSTLTELIQLQASFNDILSFGKRDKRHDEISIQNSSTIEILLHGEENITVNFDEYGVDYEPKSEDMNSPCLQYAGVVKYNFRGFNDLLSKAIFEISSFDKKLSQSDADSFKEQLLQCMDPVNKTRDLLCNSSIAQQLQTYVLQKPTKGFLGSTIIPTGNVYVAAILPIRLYSYDPKQQLEFYNELWSKLETYYEDKPNIELKGLDFNIKEAIFERMLFNDCYLGGMALFFISLAIFFYSKSFLFTLIIIVGMLLSIGTAFFIYAMVWGITFFPFINLLVLIIAIAVGADDAFLLLSQFKREKRKFEKIVAQTLNFDLSSSSLPRCEQKGSSYELTEAWMCNPLFLETNSVHYALEHALRHAAMAMFVTSATTAVAFLANYFSNILVLKCFGIFAGITMSTNYLFVITALPASILMLEGKCSRCEEATSETITFFKFGRLFIDYTKELYCYKLPRVVHRFSIPITLSTLIIGILAVYAILVDPGIRLPENNPLQVLRSSNPFEFFAEHERSLFDFSSKRQVFQIAYVLFGVSPTKDASNFVVDDVGSISLDPNFELKTLRKFQSMEKLFEDFVQLPFLKITTKDTANSWLTNFLFWAQSCNLTEHNCCGLNENTTNYSYGQCFLEYAKKSPTMPMPQDLSPLNKLMDGPIFNKSDGNFLGYYFAAPTNFQYVLIYEDLKPLFKDLNLMKGLAKDEGYLTMMDVAVDALRILREKSKKLEAEIGHLDSIRVATSYRVTTSNGTSYRTKSSYECKIHSYDGRNGHKLSYEFRTMPRTASYDRTTACGDFVVPLRPSYFRTIACVVLVATLINPDARLDVKAVLRNEVPNARFNIPMP
uniref:SSD domain-containing protein n=1 Tax=Acrobeloides nanus TaxID=290746 RepID=A0A914EL84_9BILA